LYVLVFAWCFALCEKCEGRSELRLPSELVDADAVAFFVVAVRAKEDVLEDDRGAVCNRRWPFSVDRIGLLLSTRGVSARGECVDVPNELV
jgi:hypothetical protein